MNTSLTPRLHIDFVSDVACPWCAIGLAALEQALTRVQGEIDVTLQFQPFELNPDMPPEGDDTVAYLQRKYGLSPQQVASNQQAIRERGAALGFAFGPRTRVWNTFDAHRLLLWAGLLDAAERETASADEARPLAGHQAQLKRALLQAYHGEGRNPSAVDVLLQAATEAGLDEQAAREVLLSDAHADEVRAAQAQWQQAGIRAVPSVVINGRHLIQGGQPPEVFEQALRQIAAAAAAGGDTDPAP
jgi:predicted DsbA family dithiol-disulfide isomerase